VITEAKTDDAFDALMDDMQVLYGMRPGHTVSEADLAALNRLDAYWREDSERAVDAYHRGWTQGLTHGGGVDVATLQERLDAARGQASVERALGKFAEQRGFRRGAQACREMLARFVEQGGDTVTANSIRANWNPAWGTDPGAPEDVSQPGASPAREGEWPSGQKPTEPNPLTKGANRG
jgi:hypothetical protein